MMISNNKTSKALIHTAIAAFCALHPLSALGACYGSDGYPCDWTGAHKLMDARAKTTICIALTGNIAGCQAFYVVSSE